MLGELATALGTIFSWPVIAFVLIGTVIGLLFGAIPGLGGSIALALLIPVTIGMDVTAAMALLSASIGGTAFGGSISAILIRVPGMAPNAATLIDGYPMSKQGRAGEALGISATSSALGAIFGLFIIILLIPVTRELILAFGPPELFWLAIFGLTIIAAVTRGSLLKGLVAGGLGFLVSIVGYGGATGEYRYGFGTEYLWDGIHIVVALIGLFAIAEVLGMLAKGGTISEGGDVAATKRGTLKGVRYVFQRPVTFLRASIIGVLVGIVPGAGATIANFVAYYQTVQTSRDKGSFGEGNPDGVLASESSNDAAVAGSLLPTVAFGIPGSVVMAVFLGAFILHGLSPGQQMFGENLSVLFVIIMALIVSNVLTSLLGVVFSDQIIKVTTIDVHVLSPAILVISLVGAFALRSNLGDALVAVLFGFLGFAMMVYGYSRIAFVLAFILGPIMETNLIIALNLSGGDVGILFSSGLSTVLILITIASLFSPVLQRSRG